MLINALDYLDGTGTPNVQAALDDANDGDRVYLPGNVVNGGRYISPAGGPWMIRKSIEVYGDGAGHVGTTGGTTIVPGGLHDVFCIEPPNPGPSRIEYAYLHGFKITILGASGDNGIHVKTAANKSVGEVRIERVRVLNLGGHAFFLEGTDAAGGAVDRAYFGTCGAFGCVGAGLLLRFVRHATAVRLSSNSCSGGGTLVDRSGAVFYRSSWEGNTDPNPQLWFNAAHMAIVDAGHLEDSASAALIACHMQASGGAAWVAACLFTVPVRPGTVGLKTSGSTEAGPVFVGPNHFERVEKLIDLAPDTFGAVVLPQFTNRQAIPVPESGKIVVPPTGSSGNLGLLASPTISRLPVAFREFAGLILPAKSGDPDWAVQDGMLYYDSSIDRFRVRIAGTWKTVSTSAL